MKDLFDYKIPHQFSSDKNDKCDKTLIFASIVGSHAYGTNVSTSDIDVKGVYIQNPMSILTFGYEPQINVSKDETYYEVRRFIELLSNANPTVLELLFAPKDTVLYVDTDGYWKDIILKYKHSFLTKKCEYSFGGYAIAQIKKATALDKKMNWEKERVVRKDVLDFCFVSNPLKQGSIPLKTFLNLRNLKQENIGLSKINNLYNTYNMFYGNSYKGIVGEDSNEVRVSDIPKDTQPLNAILYFNRDGYSTHCKDYREYVEWLENRNEYRYVENEIHNQKYDGKNIMHCVRLLDTAIYIAENEDLKVRKTDEEGINKLLDIRYGKVNLENVIKEAEEKIDSLKEIYAKSSLPNEVNKNLSNEILKKIRLKQLKDITI